MRLFINSLSSGGEAPIKEFNFILAGQSNAVSRSKISNDDVNIPSDLPRDGYIQDAQYYDISQVLQDYDLEMNTCAYDETEGYGVEYRVAKYLYDKDSTKVTLMKNGFGGQAVTDGAWGVNGISTTDLINKINLSGQTFDYLIWIQGESDSLTEEVANQYYVNATATFNRMRADTGQDFKLVLCNLSHNVALTPSLPYMYIVNQALSDIADNIGNAVFVDVPEQGGDAILYEQHYNGLGIETIAEKIIETLAL